MASSPAASPTDPSAKARIARTTQLFWQTRLDDEHTVALLLQEDPQLVTARDYDDRTALHVAAFFNRGKVARLLLKHSAPVNARDRWGNSPLADAENKGHHEMAKLLRENGGHVSGSHGSRLEPTAVAPPLPQRCDWEIDPQEVDFKNCFLIGKGSFGEIRKALWRGTPVAVKTILPSLSEDRLIVDDFRHEVELLVKLRHPNIVQFLGAVTVRKPLMLVTEYLQWGDLHVFMKAKGALQAAMAVDFALDIARGMTYLHNGSNVIIHRDLKPRNVLLVDDRHLKVGDFGLSKLIKVNRLHDVYKLTGETGSYRYMAPEVFGHKAYDTKVDVFSFGMIVYEMFEGSPPFSDLEPYEAAKAVAKEQRPKFSAKTYPQKMKKLIEDCWHAERELRPSFIDILNELEIMKNEGPRHEPHRLSFLHPKAVAPE